MVSWACSILDSFTRDASIGWYPFHLTKYSCSRPLSCLDLNTTSTSHSGYYEPNLVEVLNCVLD
jgi:hypothetical protein